MITDKKGIREARRRGVVCITTQEVMVAAIRAGTLTIEDADALIADWKALNDFPVTVSSFSELVDDQE